MDRKKVLVFDEPPIVDNILARLESWGYEVERVLSFRFKVSSFGSVRADSFTSPTPNPCPPSFVAGAGLKLGGRSDPGVAVFREGNA